MITDNIFIFIVHFIDKSLENKAVQKNTPSDFSISYAFSLTFFLLLFIEEEDIENPLTFNLYLLSYFPNCY
jgi:hypothetical protein